ncbi:MAG: malto-oligosyltrehalose trehalohydrolase, partial [Syntrophobacteraceae bacterium]
ERPDPASFSQPEGVHRPSEVIDLRVAGRERSWGGIALEDYIFYELHVGTFTAKGTFEGVIEKLDHISLLGATSLEVMPVAQFPGARNWGYDGAYPYAVQNSYGGPAGLRRLVDACHERGIAVTLDVVYNHFGPEGAYLRDFGPYFTNRYITPWGEAINFDDAYNDGVRNFFIRNALFWLGAFDIDALRLDAVHAIYDRSAVPFLAQLSESVRELGEKTARPRYLIAESDLNDSRIIRPREHWGDGLDSQWSDDFHHSLHSLLTGERGGYYRDFGRLEDLTTVLGEGYLYSGRYSEFRKRNHGNRSADLESKKFVVASQNHDQVGNRMLGERLSKLVSFEALKVCAAAVLLSPYLPLLFMGEEYGEEAPFLYFVDHTDPELREAVRKGRREEFKEFMWEGEVPDPDRRETFLNSRLNWSRLEQGR